jgi:hypothetical protein
MGTRHMLGGILEGNWSYPHSRRLLGYDGEIWVRYPYSINRRQASTESIFLFPESLHILSSSSIEVYKEHGGLPS